MITNSWSLIVQNPEIFSEPYSVIRGRTVHHETPNIFEIFSHEKPTPRSSSKVSAAILYSGLPGGPSFYHLYCRIWLMGLIFATKYF